MIDSTELGKESDPIIEGIKNLERVVSEKGERNPQLEILEAKVHFLTQERDRLTKELQKSQKNLGNLKTTHKNVINSLTSAINSLKLIMKTS